MTRPFAVLACAFGLAIAAAMALFVASGDRPSEVIAGAPSPAAPPDIRPNAVADVPSPRSDSEAAPFEASFDGFLASFSAIAETEEETFATVVHSASLTPRLHLHTLAVAHLDDGMVLAESVAAPLNLTIAPEALSVAADAAIDHTRDPDAASQALVSTYRPLDANAVEPTMAAAVVETEAVEVTGSLPSPAYVTVQRGDSLWSIARRNYGLGMRYETIVEANRDVLANPHRVYPGQVLVLPTRDPNWPQSPGQIAD